MNAGQTNAALEGGARKQKETDMDSVARTPKGGGKGAGGPVEGPPAVQETAPRDNPEDCDFRPVNDLSIQYNNAQTWCLCDECLEPYDAPEYIFVETETHLELCPECVSRRFENHPLIRLIDVYNRRGDAA